MMLVKATSADHKQRFGSRCDAQADDLILMILRPEPLCRRNSNRHYW